jgi:hypothetical protein
MNAIAERWIGGCRREVLDRALTGNNDLDLARGSGPRSVIGGQGLHEVIWVRRLGRG